MTDHRLPATPPDHCFAVSPRPFARLSPFVLLVLVLLFQWNMPIRSYAQTQLEQRVRTLLANADLRDTTYSISVVDLTDRENLVDLNAHRTMIPASNMKLITSVAAMDVLGPSFVFQTSLNLLPGSNNQPSDLLVIASGDPAFGDPKLLAEHGIDVERLLEKFVDAVLASGQKHFARLLVDDRVFDQNFVHPTWPRDQLNRWYCAQVAGLNFHTNCLDVTPSPADRAGLPPAIEIMPQVNFIQTTNDAVTARPRTFWISRRLGSNDITFHGKVPYRFAEPVHITVHDPPLFFARLLQERLARRGVTVDRVARVSEDAPVMREQRQPLFVFRSLMPVVLQRVLRDSQNLFAEALLKRMGYELTGQSGSWTSGSAAVRQAVHQRLGAKAANMIIADGSGMSRGNRISAALVTDLLASVYHDAQRATADSPEAAKWLMFRESLAEAGEPGTTLRHRLDDLQATVLAKTGYIREVSCLSGYIFVPMNSDVSSSTSQRAIAFSFLFNNIKHPVRTRKVKGVQDQLVELVTDRVMAAR